MNDSFRQQFPSLRRQHNGRRLVFMDGPGGTQVPQPVIDAISHYYKNSNANTHGAFITARETDAVLDGARAAVAHFLGAEGPHAVSFGQNMTTLNYSLSRAVGRLLQPGDEVLITQLDHEGNRGPWLALRELGIIVREVKLKKEGVLDYEDMAAKINERTRLLALGYASNFMGTVNDVQRARALTYQAGAWLLLDAVHFAPHFPLDVQAIGCDFLLCSAYKFYGPHVGILYSRPGLLDRLPTDRLRTAAQEAPYSIETGTLNHAALAGVKAAVDFLACFGAGPDYRSCIVDAMSQIHRHEIALARKLHDGLTALAGVSVIGPPMDAPLRAPTLAVLAEGHRPDAVARKLAEQNILAWDGHFYAIRAAEALGLLEKGGVTRLGLSAYSSEEDVEMVVEGVRGCVNV
ncbi:MAG: cysteine desulfurase-like protein [Lewinellaceae bacterium]|nr:cysteine desulfurase-like protein [Lewinellaceae bacterium]